MNLPYSSEQIKKEFSNRRISKRVAKARLTRSDAKLTPTEVRHTIQKWSTARPAKVRNANNLGVKTGAKGKREQQAA